jgi:hypothetical protein
MCRSLVSRWRRDYLMAQAAGQTPTLIPVHLMESRPALSSAGAKLTAAVDDGEIEVRRGDTAVVIRGAPDQAVLGMVLGELLQSGLGSPR